MWSVVETCLGIVCVCLLTLRPLYETAFGESSLTTNGSSSSRIIYLLSGRLGIRACGLEMNTYGSKSADVDKDSFDYGSYKEASVRSFTRLEDNA
jgi:hypothetical protein